MLQKWRKHYLVGVNVELLFLDKKSVKAK